MAHPTLRQQKLADAIIESAKKKKHVTKGELLALAGYAKNTGIGQPHREFERVGLKIALEEKGFSLDGAKQVVSEILYNPKTKDENRLRAAEQVFRVLGAYAAEKHINLDVTKAEITRLLDTLEGKNVSLTTDENITAQPSETGKE